MQGEHRTCAFPDHDCAIVGGMAFTVEYGGGEGYSWKGTLLPLQSSHMSSHIAHAGLCSASRLIGYIYSTPHRFCQATHQSSLMSSHIDVSKQATFQLGVALYMMADVKHPFEDRDIFGNVASSGSSGAASGGGSSSGSARPTIYDPSSASCTEAATPIIAIATASCAPW